jgi:hypothetical protein
MYIAVQHLHKQAFTQYYNYRITNSLKLHDSLGSNIKSHRKS